MRKVVCLNRACQPPEPIQGNLPACLSEPRFAPFCLHRLLQWKRAAILHLFSWPGKKNSYLKAAIHWVSVQFQWVELTSYSPDYTCWERKKLIQSAPILLTFDLVHEGAVFDRSALINPRSESRRIVKKIISEDRREKKKSIQTRTGGCRGHRRWPSVGNKTSGLNDSLDNYTWPIISDWSVSIVKKTQK